MIVVFWYVNVSGFGWFSNARFQLEKFIFLLIKIIAPSEKSYTDKIKAILLKHFRNTLQRFVADPSYVTVSITIVFKKRYQQEERRILKHVLVSLD